MTDTNLPAGYDEDLNRNCPNCGAEGEPDDSDAMNQYWCPESLDTCRVARFRAIEEGDA